MKHKYLLLILLLCFCPYSNAQTALPEFAPHGAHWTYERSTDYQIPGGPLQLVQDIESLIVSDHDTFFDGKTCRIMNLITPLFGANFKFYAYRDSLKIYVHTNTMAQGWLLLYDFGWQQGQIVDIYTNTNGDSILYSTPHTVTGIGDTVINGDTLPILTLSGFYRPVIMNLGPTDNYFIIDPEIYYFGIVATRCYYDTVLGYVKAPGVVVCDTDFHVGIPTITSSNSLQLYPNPATNEVHLLNTNGSVSLTEIYTIDGRMIKSIASSANNISLDGVADGMYVVMIHLRNGEVVTKKLVVEK